MKEIPDIGEMYDFYKLWNDELRDKVLNELAYLLAQIDECALTESINIECAKDLKIYIESLGKKDGE